MFLVSNGQSMIAKFTLVHLQFCSFFAFGPTLMQMLHVVWQGKRRDILDVIGRYISDEAMDKGKSAIETSGWSREYPAVPRQQNGCDCGVFTTQFASFVGAGKELDFTQENMKYFRIQVRCYRCFVPSLAIRVRVVFRGNRCEL